jgi:glycosyltransferase involved in cell wall biosynthesis
MSDKLVSVIINSHNGAKFINKSVNSVLNQTYKNLEIIFWDNASVDNSKEILQQINDPRIKINYSEKFEKLYSAKNKAVKII